MHMTFTWDSEDDEEVSIEVECELTEDEEILSLEFDHQDELTLKEFEAAYIASPDLQDRVDDACLDHALGRSLS